MRSELSDLGDGRVSSLVPFRGLQMFGQRMPEIPDPRLPPEAVLGRAMGSQA